MKRGQIPGVAAGAFLALGLLLWAAYVTLVAGTTRGPDFVAGLQSGSIPVSAVLSIEIVEYGHGAFTKREFDALAVRRVIRSPTELTKIISQLANSTPGRLHQNHPSTKDPAYLKVI